MPDGKARSAEVSGWDEPVPAAVKKFVMERYPDAYDEEIDQFFIIRYPTPHGPRNAGTAGTIANAWRAAARDIRFANMVSPVPAEAIAA
jgi:hypothetical protein